MDILVILPHSKPSGFIGGALVRTLEIIKRAKAHDINYIILENKPSFKKAFNLKCKSYEIDVYDANSIFAYTKMLIEFTRKGLEICKNENIDLIYSPLETPFSIFPAYCISKITKIPWTTMLHSVPGYWYVTGDMKNYTTRFIDIYKHLKVHPQFFRENTFLASISRWLIYKLLRDTTSLTVSRSTSKIISRVDKDIKTLTVVPGNGIDLDAISAVKSQNKLFDAMFFSVMIPEKGIFDVIDIWSQVVKKMGSKKLVMIGKGYKGTIGSLKMKIKERGLEKDVVFPYNPFDGVPKREEVWSLMKQSRILIYPSKVDSWSLIVGEALACGLPVIAYDIPPNRYAYGDCESVFMFPMKNLSGMTSKTIELIQNKSLLMKCVRKSKLYARRQSWEKVVLAEKKVYESLIKGGNHHKN